MKPLPAVMSQTAVSNQQFKIKLQQQQMDFNEEMAEDALINEIPISPTSRQSYTAA
jgi:hypothetical protein